MSYAKTLLFLGILFCSFINAGEPRKCIIDGNVVFTDQACPNQGRGDAVHVAPSSVNTDSYGYDRRGSAQYGGYGPAYGAPAPSAAKCKSDNGQWYSYGAKECEPGYSKRKAEEEIQEKQNQRNQEEANRKARNQEEANRKARAEQVRADNARMAEVRLPSNTHETSSENQPTSVRSIFFAFISLITLVGIIGAQFKKERLQKKFRSLGNMTGKTKNEIIKVAGPPNSTSDIGNGSTLLQWQADGYHIAIRFDENNRFASITHEFSA